MTLADLEKLEAKLRKSPKDANLQLEIVTMLRTEKIRRPDLIVQCGPNLIEKHRSKLGNGIWDVREQVFTAALDLHDQVLAKAQLDALLARFPASSRVKSLEGVMYEALACSARSQQMAAEQAEKALEKYDEILEADPFNATARKRRVCVQKASGAPDDMTAAARCMNEYLDMFPQDHDAWKELADMYLEQQQLDHARKALEEVVMLQPVNYLNHLKLAEVLYSLDDIPLARKYYAQSLELNRESNPRAAIGMVLCTTAVHAKAKGKSDTSNSKLYAIGRQLLLDQFSSGGKEVPESKAIKSWLKA